MHMADSTSHGISSAKAVLLGALAPGINGPTWMVLKITLMMLTICLIAMLSLAFISSDFIIVGHVILLIVIGAVLFVLLNRRLMRCTICVEIDKRAAYAREPTSVHKLSGTDWSRISGTTNGGHGHLAKGWKL